MGTIKEYFSHGVNSAGEKEERIYIYTQVPKRIKNSNSLTQADERAADDIKRMENMIEILKAYRVSLFERFQEINAADYKLQLKLKRDVRYTDNKKYYYITLSKIFSDPSVSPELIINQCYGGTERRKAFKRFEELEKIYPTIETITDTDRRNWEN